MTTATLKLKHYIRREWFYGLFPLLFIGISLVLIISNRSFIFEYAFLNKVGDQKLYYSLARKLAQFYGEKSYYTLGYPLLYLPFVILTGVQESWTSIMPYIISLQAFVLMPASIWLIFSTKRRRYALISLLYLAIYYLGFMLRSDDILTKYNFFGLVPLSEPLSVFLLLLAYHVYLLYFYKKVVSGKLIVLLAILIAWGVLTRNISAVLYAPLFLDLLLRKKLKMLVQLCVWCALLYAPQLLYNFLVSGDVLFNGYTWSASLRVERNTKSIQQLYGIHSSALFSLQYFKVNVTALFWQYTPLGVLMVLNLLKKNRLVLLVVAFSLINLIIYLSYWWSKAGGLFDRFLLPNVFLLFYLFQNTLVQARGNHLEGNDRPA